MERGRVNVQYFVYTFLNGLDLVPCLQLKINKQEQMLDVILLKVNSCIIRKKR
jgi:hypothetical protein